MCGVLRKPEGGKEAAAMVRVGVGGGGLAGAQGQKWLHSCQGVVEAQSSSLTDGLGGKWRVLRVRRKTRMTPRVLTATGRKMLSMARGGSLRHKLDTKLAQGVLEGGAGR